MDKQKPVAWAVSYDGETPSHSLRTGLYAEETTRGEAKGIGRTAQALPLYAHPSEELAEARAEAEQFRALAKANSLELIAAIRESRNLLAAMAEARNALQFANDSPGGPITGTIWMMHRPETLFDFMDAAISAGVKGGAS